jgi:hypothetical protein
MTITEIQKALKEQGINFKPAQIEEKLQAYEMKPDQVTPEVLTGWVEDLRQSEDKPAKGRGGGLAKNKSEAIATPPPSEKNGAIAKSETKDMAPQPPVEQGEPVEEIRIEIPAQAIANVENLAVGMILKIDNQVDAMATSVARLANNAPALFAYKLNQKIGMQRGATEAQSLAEHDGAWSASRSRINDLINNIQQGAIAS